LSDGNKKLWFEPKDRGGSEPLLYGGERLADVVNRQPVFIVEGENKVDRLRGLGAVAVSGDTGESSRWLPSHAKLLRGLDVVLWPDSDDSGERYIANAAKCLQGHVASLKVIRLFGLPNGAKGLDVCDWKGTADDLIRLVASAAAYEPPANGERESKVVFENAVRPKCEMIAPEFSEDRLALRFVDLHGDKVRYVAAWRKWLTWTGTHWEFENTLAVFDMARKICCEAARQCNKPSEAKALSKAKVVAAVEMLARSDRRIAATIAQWDAEPSNFNAKE
jgi:DNA primase